MVGSGIAGLTAALCLAGKRSVTLVTKSRVEDTSTWHAQGGIAGAVGETDSVELHLADTLAAGAGINAVEVVQAVVGEAAEALRELQAFGVGFDYSAPGKVSLAREGGHSLPRILHSGDATGAAVQDALSRCVRQAAKVEILEERFLVDLLVEEGRCTGAIVRDMATGIAEECRADAVVLATGGCGQVYRVTTNPAIATGDGVAAAWRAGAEITDLEFVQFHPTALDHESSPKFLITEALRGEGAYLLDCAEQRFMLGVHPLAELAPRDVVSREIESVMARCGRPNVWLDARHLGGDYLKQRFPTIWEMCVEAGYNLATDLIPVAPAAHYMIGGVRVDIDGRSSLAGLFATGEVAASGLHGANRLASNSLLEGLVFSRRIARALLAEEPAAHAVHAAPPHSEAPQAAAAVPDAPAAAAIREQLQEVMSSFVGVTRSAESLAHAARGIATLASASGAADDPELVNLLTVATLITQAAAAREETRGTHYRDDFPDRRDDRWRGHLVWCRGEPVRFEPTKGGDAG